MDRLSSSLEDYLEAIAALTARDGHAHCRAIALRLGVKMPSVTTALRNLAARGLLEYRANQPVVLTPAGRAHADEVARRHAVLQRFLATALRVDADRGASLACQLEHVFDTEMVDRLLVLTEALERRADASSLRVHLTEAMARFDRAEQPRAHCVLTQLHAGENAVVVELGANLPDADRLRALGVDAGRPIRRAADDDAGRPCFFLDDRPLALSPSEAENIWARRQSRAHTQRRFRPGPPSADG